MRISTNGKGATGYGIAVAGIGILGLFGAIRLLTAPFRDIVSIEELQPIPSPDGRKRVVIISSDAGATTSVGHQVFLEPANTKGTGRVLVARFYGAVTNGQYGIRVYWKSNDTVVLTCDSHRWSKLLEETVPIANTQVKITLQPPLPSSADSPANEPEIQRMLDKWERDLKSE